MIKSDHVSPIISSEELIGHPDLFCVILIILKFKYI